MHCLLRQWVDNKHVLSVQGWTILFKYHDAELAKRAGLELKLTNENIVFIVHSEGERIQKGVSF